MIVVFVMDPVLQKVNVTVMEMLTIAQVNVVVQLCLMRVVCDGDGVLNTNSDCCSSGVLVSDVCCDSGVLDGGEVCDGDAVEDPCGECGGTGVLVSDVCCSTGVVDCADECDGSAVEDPCGVCGGDCLYDDTLCGTNALGAGNFTVGLLGALSLICLRLL